MNIKHIPLVGKFLLIVALFGLTSAASVVLSTTAMRHIDDGYGEALDHETLGATLLARVNTRLNQARAAMGDLQVSSTDEGNRAAMAEFKTARQAMLDNLAKARAALPAFVAPIDQLSARALAVLDDTCDKANKMALAATEPAAVAAGQAEFLKTCQPAIFPLVEETRQLVDKARAAADDIHGTLTAMTSRTIMLTYAAVLAGIGFVTVCAYFAITAWVSRPVKQIVDVMSRLAAGDLSVAVDGTDRGDELGPMARAVEVFKTNGVKLKETEAEAARQRQVAEQERAANEAARAAIQRHQEIVVTSIAAGLDRLSKGDLTGRLQQAFSEEYEKLRSDFNATAGSLQEALGKISRATNGITSGTDQIAHASDDLARRTEQQAANLEETAAALNIITDTVKAMAGNAADAAKVVLSTRSAAEASGLIVQDAVDAMGKIKDSSNQISNIIGVIDEIAFQTNLLALNAGVEAARAGDAGRGFAVVASEVRGLAQRSAEAAKEIKSLISSSTVQVEAGVILVDRTGTALKDIIGKIAEMDGLIGDISQSSQEQATSIAEINTAVRQMDQVVQQNAAMVEESTAAAHALKSETLSLSDMVGRFEIGSDTRAAVRHSEPKRTKPTSAPRASSRGAPVSTGAVAHKIDADSQDDWQEF